MLSVRKLVNLSVVGLIVASVLQMLGGNDERGVLMCFWASLILGLYGVSK